MPVLGATHSSECGGDLSRQCGLGRAGKELGIELFDRFPAGARADDDSLGVPEVIQDLGCHRAGGIPFAGVERGLAAAGDFRRAERRVAQSLQYLNPADARAREQRVHKTGDEKGGGHSTRAIVPAPGRGITQLFRSPWFYWHGSDIANRAAAS